MPSQDEASTASDNSSSNIPPTIPAGPGTTQNTITSSEVTDKPYVKPPHKVQPDLRSEELLHGTHPGDTFIRVSRTAGPFRRLRPNVLSASLETETARTPLGRSFNSIKKVLIGQALSSEQSIHERLTKVKALAILSSDALSSVAYATEEILRVLILAGASALTIAVPLGIGVALLLAIVAASYRQTIAAYPRGGGSYIVAKDNLGVLPGLTAAASILIDYTMTVAVSVSAGIAAIYSLFPEVRPYRVEICLVVVVLVTVANLRGVREAGNIFAVPTYMFVFGILAMVLYGLARLLLGDLGPASYIPPGDVSHLVPKEAEQIGIFLLLRAFTQGCTALTGVEAIADGVPAFKPPEASNARTTLLWMAIIAISMFAGITYLATSLKILPSESETVLSQLARTIFPRIFGADVLWFFINITTALILVLAANTAFSDFPRLSYFLARDRFMPRQYAFRGDRLAFSWGIVTLAVLAAILIIAFDGDTTNLIPLYTVGVFASFTLSQSGMVRRWWLTRTPGWQQSMALNGLGALATFAVLIVSAVTKFASGAWIVLLLVPILITIFLAINRHYERVKKEIATVQPMVVGQFAHTFIVPVASLNAVTMTAVAYARSLSPNVTAVHIVEGEDTEEAEEFNRQWHAALPGTDVSLVIIESPFRSLIGPLLSYIDALDQQHSDDTVTIILPEVIPAKWWEYILHNQSALRLKARLLFRPNTVVADVPYQLGRGRQGTRGSAFSTFPWMPVISVLAIVALIYLIFFRR